MKSYRTFFRWLACILLAAWSTGALKLYGVIPNADKLGDELYDVIQYLFFGGNAIGWIVLIIAISVFYHWISKRITFSVKILIPALILVLAFVLGSFLEFRNLVESARSYSIFVMLASPGTLVLFYSLLWKAFYVLRTLEDKSPAPPGRIVAFYERHPMPLTMGILLVCWLPYIILYCPGTIQYDGAMQLNMFFGRVPFTTHHPPLTTWLMGGCIQLGRYLGSDSIGAFIFTSLQTLFLAAVISLAVKTMIRWRLPRCVTFTVLGYFALFSAWPAYNNMFLKTTLYSASFLLYQLVLIGFFQKKQGTKSLVFLFFTALLLTLTRNNGIIVVVFTAVVFLLFKLPTKKQFFSVSCAVLAAYLCISNILFPMLGIQKGSRRESLSIPFQQVARYLKYHGDEVTAEERDSIARVLDYDVLAENYTPYFSDPVKDTFREEASVQDMRDFFSTWMKLFWKHPNVYLKSFVDGSYLYLYPAHRAEEKQCILHLHQGKTNKVDDAVELDYTVKRFDSIRPIVSNKLFLSAYYTPVIRYLHRAGFYTWILIVLLSYLIYRKKYKEIICFVPVVVMLLTNIASPVNGSIRYTMPIMAALPVLWGFVLSHVGREPQGQTEK